jgi:acyl dehydratase/NAD(P)-dependent dehydrogenase (short-subunit alcohol dehydrogenase family)
VEQRRVAKTVVARRTFTSRDQDRFAELTGDRNPIHVDEIAARRTQAGSRVVHGMHAVLWALDRLIALGTVRHRPTTIEVTFQRFIYLDEEVSISNVRSANDGLKVALTCANVVAATISVAWKSERVQDRPSPGGPIADLSHPAELALRELAGRSGQLPQADSAITGDFRAATDEIGASPLAALAQLSTLVGMVCPGLHSIFGSVRVHFASSPSATPLSYVVRKVDDRFALVDIDVSGSGIYGSVSAFLRRAPVSSPQLSDIRARLLADEFASTTALIIGGSRGLGEVTAKAIVAAGGRAIITYAKGKHDGDAIARELGPDACQAIHFDACQDAAAQLVALPWPPNALYYFASPQIFRQKAAWFVQERFREFCDFYVAGFADVFLALYEACPTLSMVFYPSSIVLDERAAETPEYAAAKAAGEQICEDLRARFPTVTIHSSRLPRVLTDQTATIIPVEAADALDVMLPIIRELNRAREDRLADPTREPAYAAPAPARPPDNPKHGQTTSDAPP